MTAVLRRSNDRKVANSVTPAGRARIANSFGLPAGKAYSCPGMTPTCERVCYAGKLERAYPDLLPMLLENWRQLKRSSHAEMVSLLDQMVAEFEAECEKWSAPKVFRIHWDGDFFSDDYAAAWSIVIGRHPETKFWAYTRVYSAWQLLFYVDRPNLALYFSGDPDNAETALAVQGEGGKVAMLADTFAQARSAMPDKAVACPELMGRIPLSGACVACGACIRGRSNIAFSITKK